MKKIIIRITILVLLIAIASPYAVYRINEYKDYKTIQAQVIDLNIFSEEYKEENKQDSINSQEEFLEQYKATEGFRNEKNERINDIRDSLGKHNAKFSTSYKIDSSGSYYFINRSQVSVGTN